MTQEQIQATEIQALRMPAIAIRGLVMFPKMVLHFDVARQKSILALNQAMKGNQKIFLVTQKNSRVEEPGKEDLYTVGVVAKVKQILKAQGEAVRVVVEGKYRARMCELIRETPYYEVLCQEMPMEPVDENKQELVDAYMRVIKDLFEDYSYYAPKMPKELVINIIGSDDPIYLTEYLTQNLGFPLESKQQILEESNVRKRLELLSTLLHRESEVLKIEHSIAERVKDQVDRNQKEYYLREQLKAIHAELGDDDDPDQEIAQYYEKLRAMNPDEETRQKLSDEINKLSKMMYSSQEAMVSRNYLDTVFSLPWNQFTEDKLDVKAAEEKLNADHYGLQKVKERILEILAVRKLEPDIKGQIICLVGPPGVGKTSIARSIAEAMGRKYVRMSLGGVRDEAEIRGHRKTYVGAMPGRIVEGLKQAGVANPLMLLDEIDKVSSDYKGDTSSALLEVLDSEQNVKFRDHYVEIPIDLSEVLFIATANTTQTIPGPLLDRMELIEVNSYTENEKYHIAKDYLIPKQLEKNGLSKEQLNITGSALEKMIHSYTRESGVRNLERRVGDICRKAAREVLEKKKPSIRVTERNLDHYLGREKVFFDAAGNEAQVGIVRGLAWTSVGGDTLQIEVNVMPGKGVLQMTGQMGDVMKESAQIALTYVRSVASDYGVKENYFEKHDIHLHIPEGAVPKDGPSAGITMATAMLSAVTGRKVLPRVAMTGEVTLRGHVLMIGGLKEKLLAARMAQVEKVLVPAKNQPDVEELSKEITKGMEIVYIKEMNEVIREAFVPEK